MPSIKSNLSLSELKQSLINDLDNRVADRILEPANRDLLKKLINNAENKTEAISIAELGTTYKRTGFHFDKKLEKQTDTIKYFKKNNKLSFVTDENRLTHKLIIGDNYDALLNLSISYKGKIDVIYIDPPYGKDDLGDFAQTNYDNAITRDNLLSMLYPRLVLAKELLSDDGVIFCSIDDKNQAYVKCLFDEVFGEQNFEGNIHWRRRHNQPNDKNKLIAIVAEHILCYSKDRIRHKEFGVGKLDKLTGKFSNPDADKRGDWSTKAWKTGTGQSGTRYSITTPSGKVFNEEWMGDENTYNSLLADNRIYFPNNGEGFPRKKYFKSERKKEGQCATNWWRHEDFGSNQEATTELKSIFSTAQIFENPKPTKLLKAIVFLGSIKDDAIVLDFFAGSGTTGQAVLELNKDDGGNRTFILCTNNEVTKSNPNGIAYDVTSKRLKRVMTGECYDGSKDFKWNKDHQPLGDNLDVYEIEQVSNINQTPGECAFDVIDETLYGIDKLEPKEKIRFVCENFSVTQKTIEE